MKLAPSIVEINGHICRVDHVLVQGYWGIARCLSCNLIGPVLMFTTGPYGCTQRPSTQQNRTTSPPQCST